MSFSRRQFIQASGIALCAGALPLTANAAGQQQPLPIPPLIEHNLQLYPPSKYRRFPSVFHVFCQFFTIRFRFYEFRNCLILR